VAENRLSGSASIGVLIIRLALGAVFVYHGSQKLFGAFGGPGLDGFAGFLETMHVPAPHVSAVLAACAEFGGGLALGTGIMLRLLAVPLVFTMLVASWATHGNGFDIQHGGMEYSLILALIVTGVAILGPGRYALGGGD
jgi:putative oxidoreductase